jgi:hypothetical protein
VVVSTLAVPCQLNLRLSNLALLLPMSGSIAMVRPVMAKTLPSRGAVLKMLLAARSPPAPGMCCTTRLGLPGRRRPM